MRAIGRVYSAHDVEQGLSAFGYMQISLLSSAMTLSRPEVFFDKHGGSSRFLKPVTSNADTLRDTAYACMLRSFFLFLFSPLFLC